MAKKRKRNVPKMSHIIETRKAIREWKQMNRASRKLVEVGGDLMPEGWETMSKSDYKIDDRRRAAESHRARPKKDPNTLSVCFNFTPGEIGVNPPSPEEVQMMKEMNPQLGKKLEHFKPLEHVMSTPVVLTREPEITMKEQWAKARLLMKQTMTDRQKQTAEGLLQQRTEFNPDAPTTLDLDNLTTLGD